VARTDISTGRWAAGRIVEVFRRPSEPPPLTRDEVTQLIAMFMRIEWKLDLVLEELEIDYGEEEDRP
jgi:hypothetical protein